MLLALLLTLTASLADGGVDDAVDGGPEQVLRLAAPLPPPEPEPELHLAAPLPPPAGAPPPELPQKYQPQAQPPPPQGAVTATPAPPPADAGVEVPPVLKLHGAAEADLGLFPTGFPENGFDLMTSLHPVIGFGVGEDFGIELGPTFRLRLIDTPSLNRPSDVGSVLRGADWDELSDFGQILQSLKIARETSLFHLRIGPARKKSLGLGHLMWRYGNQANPDYHPASGTVVLNTRPLRAEFFASDILGARLFAGDLAWDIGGTFSADPAVKDRYVLAFELAHDANLSARPFRPDRSVAPFTVAPVTLLHLDASAVLVRNAALRWMVMAGTGVRANDTGDLGLLVGMTLDANVKEIGFSTRLELRKQAGGFRHGFFGPMYELQRFVDIGYRGDSIGAALLPDGLSAFGELRVGIGTRVSFDAAAEYFFWNRLDLDGGLSIALLDDWFFLTARTTIVGIAQQPRFAFNAGLRWRLFPSFYVLGEGGTLFFPQADGSLIRGVSVSAGAGVDFER